MWSIKKIQSRFEMAVSPSRKTHFKLSENEFLNEVVESIFLLRLKKHLKQEMYEKIVEDVFRDLETRKDDFNIYISKNMEENNQKIESLLAENAEKQKQIDVLQERMRFLTNQLIVNDRRGSVYEKYLSDKAANKEMSAPIRI
jgi:uncharacterized coiled-coil protein SlyX